jgi:hypothetical protein
MSLDRARIERQLKLLDYIEAVNDGNVEKMDALQPVLVTETEHDLMDLAVVLSDWEQVESWREFLESLLDKERQRVT